ncbi:MAG: nucleotide exchange factor GrpE [Anaerovibrio sp.]|uniref:nucleotide exchange factor GrpE n=1 Tax=Anaerovibrio sp. TaxID=1872532 RepID=UPI0025D541BE|nr:nucleotide exchange factor GrpE [Anaerovibrio sp.]MCR5176766.1 nucleotide exchange factor GrpE [Anaerovibrio sp.]
MPFDKDKLKKKDEEKLEEMQREIDEHEMSADESDNVEAAADNVEDVPQEKDELEQLKEKLADDEERYKRLQADFENFRRRTRQEKEELSALVVQNFITELLPMVDNFERALAAEANDTAAFKQGVDMIFNQFMEVLKNRGLEKIETKDAKFDPNYHQAVMRVENPELEDDTIAMEMQKGYMVKGKVIRPAMVQVVAN